MKIPKWLLDDFLEMGITVHLKLGDLVKLKGQKNHVERIGTYTMLTTSINMASWKQTFIKRAMDMAGGIEVVVEELAVRMVKQGHRALCYNRRGHHVSKKKFDGNSLIEYKGIRLKTVFTVNRKGLAAMTSSVSAAIKAAVGAYDIVHFHAEGPCAMLWLPKLFRKRCIVTIHGFCERIWSTRKSPDFMRVCAA